MASSPATLSRKCGRKEAAARYAANGLRKFAALAQPARSAFAGPSAAFTPCVSSDNLVNCCSAAWRSRSCMIYLGVGPQLATATVSSRDRPSTTITSRSPCGSEERTYGRFFLVQGRDHNADRHTEGRNRRPQLVALDGRPPGLPGGEVHSTRYFRSTLPAGFRGMSSRNSTSWGTL